MERHQGCKCRRIWSTDAFGVECPASLAHQSLPAQRFRSYKLSCLARQSNCRKFQTWSIRPKGNPLTSLPAAQAIQGERCSVRAARFSLECRGAKSAGRKHSKLRPSGYGVEVHRHSERPDKHLSPQMFRLAWHILQSSHLAIANLRQGWQDSASRRVVGTLCAMLPCSRAA